MRAIVLGLVMLGSACALESNGRVPPIATGEWCEIEQVPEEGFNDTEAYLQTSDPQCESNVCMVYRLHGNPREICEDRVTTNCASRAEVERRVYCTCRCDGAPDVFDNCECPDGFTCHPVLELGGPGVQGSYCVRDGTFDPIRVNF